MKKTITILIFVFTMLITPFFINDVIGQPPPPPPQPIPIDGGLSLLIVAGAAYGAKKLHKQQKSEDN